MWWASALLAPPSTSPRIVAPRACAASHSSSTNAAAPSPITNPSRSTSNGRLVPLPDRAVMLLKPAIAVTVPACSVPPETTASAMSHAIKRAAYVRACVPAAQAVQIVSAGPRNPNRIDTAAPDALAIIIGTRNGETRRSPLSIRMCSCSSSVWMPPTPVPKIVPIRAGSAVSSPACSIASIAAATANCSTRSARRESLGDVVVRRRIPIGDHAGRPAAGETRGRAIPARTLPCPARRARRHPAR